MITAAVLVAAAWRAPAQFSRPRAAVRAAPRACAADNLPTDLETVSEGARGSIREALLTGRRGLRADVNIPSLDPTGPSYEPAVLARFALDLLQTFSVVPSDGELLLLLPGALICAEAQRLLDGADFVPAELRASGRVRISSWALEAPPAEGAETPAAVLIVGLAPSENSDDDSLVRARGWLRLAQTASTAVLSLNARLGAAAPAELSEWEAVYSLASYVVSRVDGNAVGAVNRVPMEGEARSNLHVGGSAVATGLTARDLEICERIGPKLRRRGLLFVGIDVIGDYLTEINVTSPTGVREILALSGIDVPALTWDAIEAARPGYASNGIAR